MFDYAKGKEFGLFFSFDFYAANDLSAHQSFYDTFKDEDAYYKYGPDSLNVISTFSGGDLGPDTWASFKETNNVYLIPNPESDGNYYSNSATFFQNWDAALDGVFSWETAWPGEADTPTNVTSTRDQTVKDAADNAGKAYMMGNTNSSDDLKCLPLLTTAQASLQSNTSTAAATRGTAQARSISPKE